MNAMKLERFEMRAEEEWLKALDDWRRRQADLPSRAEAIRRLVDAALAAEQAEANKAKGFQTQVRYEMKRPTPRPGR